MIAPWMAVLTGTLQALGPCLKGDVQVWISSGDTVLLQETVKVGREFEFVVTAGKLTVVASSTSGCYAETQLTVAAQEKREIKLELASGGRSRNLRKP